VLGAPVRLTASFYDMFATLVDPSTVSVNLNLPNGTTVNYTAVRDSTGVYHYDYTPAATGIYDYWFTGTGSNAATQAVDTFTVVPSASTALISLADAKNQLNKAATSINPLSSDNSEILGFITAASEIVNKLCGYSRPTSFTEYSTPKWNALATPNNVYASLVVRRLPLWTVTSIVPQFYGGALSLTGLVTDLDAGIVYIPITSLVVGYIGPVAITYQAGRASVPVVLQEATMLIVQGMWESQRGPAMKPMMGDDSMVMAPGVGQYIPARALEMMKQSPYFAAPVAG
jgi:hypothetical protein